MTCPGSPLQSEWDLISCRPDPLVQCPFTGSDLHVPQSRGAQLLWEGDAVRAGPARTLYLSHTRASHVALVGARKTAPFSRNNTAFQSHSSLI